jgi:hypothetical protein
MDMIIDILKNIFLLFIPRFTTKNFAIYIDDDGDWDIYCLEEYITDDDEGEYNAIGQVNYFTWFGVGFNLKLLDAWDV